MRIEGRKPENRFTKAGDVLKVKEEPEAAWDQRDVAKAVEFLEDWPRHISALGDLVASLDMIAPGTVQPEQRVAIVEYLLGRIERQLAAFKVGGVTRSGLVHDVGELLLVDPSARGKIPQLELVCKEFDRYFAAVDSFETTSSSPQLFSYVLMEPDGKRRPHSVWLRLMDKAKKRWEAHQTHFNFSPLQPLCLARVMYPEQFSAHPPSEEMRQSILSQAKKARASEKNSIGFGGGLFQALILAADEVSVTRQHGLQVKWPAAKLTPGSKLPERNTV